VTKIFALASQKGGVGKTTVSTNLAGLIARFHAPGRVLLVDCDPQANATATFLGDRIAYGPMPGMHIAHGLCDGVGASELIQKATLLDNGKASKFTLDVLPSHVDAAASDLRLYGMMNRERQLQNCLEDVMDRYDYIVIDCPPSLSLITINALAAADHVIIPCEPSKYSVVGMAQLLRTVESVKTGRQPINAKLSLFGVTLVRADTTRMTLDTLAELGAQFKDKLLPTIPSRTAVREAQRANTDLYGFTGDDPDNPVLGAFREIAQKMTARHGKK
jgi:chromosome partitioning protein